MDYLCDKPQKRMRYAYQKNTLLSPYYIGIKFFY